MIKMQHRQTGEIIDILEITAATRVIFNTGKELLTTIKIKKYYKYVSGNKHIQYIPIECYDLPILVKNIITGSKHELRQTIINTNGYISFYVLSNFGHIDKQLFIKMFRVI